jgi:peptidoglycan/xylan/chitin deacetylase (PgdA/CDA1 family)
MSKLTRGAIALSAAVVATGAFAVANAKAAVVLTFDDCPNSSARIAAPTLAQYGLRGTFYVISGKLGPMWGHCTADDVRQMAAEGMEIGSHTVNHLNLASIPLSQAVWEMNQSKTDLESIVGAPVTDFAYPEGGLSGPVESACEAIYATCRGFGGAAVNTHDSFDAGDVRTFGVNLDVRFETVKGWIDQGSEPGVLVVLVFHDIGDPPSSIYGTKPHRFERIVRYLAGSSARASRQGPADVVLTMAQAQAQGW